MQPARSLVPYGRTRTWSLVYSYQGMYTRAVHSTACGTIQLTTKYTNSKISYQICYEHL
eukprot:SAG31_NODE_14156_length_824_cov_1.303448_2_plen_58_part_01